jgi:DNA-binding CsgD family transcriptional regulator
VAESGASVRAGNGREPSATIGRAAEVAELQAVIDDGLRGRGGALLYSGPAGIGKSALLTHAAGYAAAAGARVLSASGVPTEYAFGFSLLDQLLRPVAAEAARLPALGTIFGAPGEPAPVYAVARATLDLVTTVAEQAPLVVVVDDLHWADSASATVLTFIGRRLNADSVVLVGAYRDDSDNDLAIAAGLPVTTLPPLNPQMAARLLQAYAPELDPATRRRILSEAEGNPLALTELARAPRRDPRTTEPGELPLSTRLEHAFARQAATLPEPARLALLVAALGEGRLDEVLNAAAAVAGRRLELADVQPAVDARLVQPLGADLTVRFRHPLVRSALRQNAEPDVRRACHLALAEVTGDEPERRAWHRAAAALEPDEDIAGDLEAAARTVRDRGNASAAHRMFLLAAELSAEPDSRHRRLLAALVAAARMGDTPETLRLVRMIDPERLDLPHRIVYALFRESYVDLSWSSAHLVPRSAEPGSPEPVDEDYTQVLVSVGELAIRVHAAAEPNDPLGTVLLDTIDRLPGSPAEPGRLFAEALLAPVDRGASLLQRIRNADPLPLGPVELYEIGTAALLTGDTRRAAGFLKAAVAALRASSSLSVLVNALSAQATAELILGDARLAAACADESARLAPEVGQPLYLTIGQASGAVAAALRGDAAGSEALSAAAEQALIRQGAVELLSLVRWARGLNALATGRPGQAYDELIATVRPGGRGLHPYLGLFFVQPLAEAAVRAGRHAELRDVVAELNRTAARCQWPVLLRALRYAEAVLAPEDRADDAHQRALSAEDLAPLDRAHLQLAYGQWLRRRRRTLDSRPPLRAAMTTYDALGLAPWADSARAQLRATGEVTDAPQPSAVDQLTPQELQIAAMAAQGLTNRDIAERLYVSHRTVSSHLYRIYPKLGVASRNDLSAVLGGAARHFQS